MIENILKITSDERVELGVQMKELLNKELCLGMTRWVCRHGTLSDGFEKITPAQKYYQAIREVYNLSNNIRGNKAQALKAHADLLDAQEALALAEKPSQKLRAEADVMIATDRIAYLLVHVEDQMRQLDEFYKVYKELQPEVRAKYPEGIEQAEEDNWQAVAQYRLIKAQTPDLHKADMAAVPLPYETKAKYGLQFQRPDMMAPMILSDEKKMTELHKDFEMAQGKVALLKGK